MAQASAEVAWRLARVAGISAVLVVRAGFAQPAPAASGSAVRPTFEVASVKRTEERMINNVFRVDQGKLTCHTMGLHYLTAWAYKMPFYQVIIPDWTLEAAINIEAKAAQPVGEDQVRLMLQALLEERFKLKVHRETREKAVLALVVDKGGPRLKASQSEGHWRRKLDRATLRETVTGISMREFAEEFLTMSYPGVIDRTGIAGRYDVTLDYRSLVDPGDTSIGRAIVLARADALKPLGLKLQAVKASLDFLVVDHVEKYPTEN
jgi:uncharacterized protein (TIGR03435 family)